jgi:transcriptional regulator with XRE-family HTH domain
VQDAEDIAEDIASLPTDWSRACGAEVARRRVAAGMSQATLGRLIRKDTGTISRIERGLYSGSDDTRYRLATALGCEVSDLYAYPPVTEAAS